MSSVSENYCIDAADPYAQALWWNQVLDDYEIDPDEPPRPDEDETGLVSSDGRRFLLFLKVPEAKSIKNRMHICLRPVDRTRDEEVERLLALGATMFDDRRKPTKGWAVLADPEGNEFCVLMRLSDFPA